MSHLKLIRTFTTEDNKTYVILKDMFEALGRVKEDGGWYKSKSKTEEFLALMGKVCDSQLLRVTSKTINKRSRESQEFDCLLLGTAPILIMKKMISNYIISTKNHNHIFVKKYKIVLDIID